jgi:uncharacterized protein (TIGR03792 family)
MESGEDRMVIEWQKIRVKPEARDHWLERDLEIWTAGLARRDGFLGKEVWLGEEGSEVILIVRWRSEEDWKGIPREHLDDLERRFSEAISDDVWERIEMRSYRVARSS